MTPDDCLKKASDPDETVRAMAMLELGHMKTPSAIQALCTGLRDEDPSVRCNAACALSEIGPLALSAETLLEESLFDLELDVRAASAQALGRIGANGAVSALLRLADDADWFVRAEVTEALARIAPFDAAVRIALGQLLAEPRVRKMSPTAQAALRLLHPTGEHQTKE